MSSRTLQSIDNQKEMAAQVEEKNAVPYRSGVEHVALRSSRQSLSDMLLSLSIMLVTQFYKPLQSIVDYIVMVTGAILVFLYVRKWDQFAANHMWRYTHLIAKDAMTAAAVAIIFVLVYRRRDLRRNVYLLDISCFRPPNVLRAPHSTFLEHSRISKLFEEDSLNFQRKILERSGLGQQTAFPMCFRYLPPKPSMIAAREEGEAVLFACMDDLLEKTKVNPKDIGVVVVNCSTFNPTPSLSAMIVNRYKLLSNTKTYNLGGMGCSAGIIALDLAKNSLLVHRNIYAVVFSTENITQNWYWGNNRTMLVSNCLFRVGGSAILLSNKPRDKRRAKYRLEDVVRTHNGADNAAYHAAYQDQDSEQNVGVFLSKDLMKVAAETLRFNMTALGPLVLPYSEQLRFVANLISREVLKSKIPTHIPNFKRAFEHFCIHSGGRAVISAVEKALKLSLLDVEPTRMTLHRFGNTSASTTWYQFQYLEAQGRVKKGDRIWQLAFGSGFKCNSAVWTALRTIDQFDPSNAWFECIMDYPVPTPDYAEL